MSPTFSSLPVAGITCMTPIAPTRLLALLIEPRLLVALRHHQQVVHVVLVAVLADRSAPASRNFLSSASEVAFFTILRVLAGTSADSTLPNAVPLRASRDERVQLREQLRAVLADGPGRDRPPSHGR